MGGAMLSSREYSMQEAGYLLCGWDLRGSTRSFKNLTVNPPGDRIRMLDRQRLRTADQEQPAEAIFMANIFDHYAGAISPISTLFPTDSRRRFV